MEKTAYIFDFTHPTDFRTLITLDRQIRDSED